MRYTEHPLAQKLKDSSIYDYTPEWKKNVKIEKIPKKSINKPTKKTKKRGFDNF